MCNKKANKLKFFIIPWKSFEIFSKFDSKNMKPLGRWRQKDSFFFEEENSSIPLCYQWFKRCCWFDTLCHKIDSNIVTIVFIPLIISYGSYVIFLSHWFVDASLYDLSFGILCDTLRNIFVESLIFSILLWSDNFWHFVLAVRGS